MKTLPLITTTPNSAIESGYDSWNTLRVHLIFDLHTSNVFWTYFSYVLFLFSLCDARTDL